MTEIDRATPAPTTPAGAGTQSRPLTVLLTSVAYFMVTLDALVVVTALPSIHRQLGGGIATLQWTVSAYTMAFGAGIITAAALGDRLGRPARLRARPGALHGRIGGDGPAARRAGALRRRRKGLTGPRRRGRTRRSRAGR